MAQRLETLKSMVAERPTDTFSRYALAMEYTNAGDYEAAAGEFAALLEHNPNYGAGYFHGGRALEKLGKFEEARSLYRRGIAATAGDEHAQAEMQAALAALPQA